jgi:general secretion pathway protein A
MYEAFYGLREKPFSLTPDPAYFYRSPTHANALDLIRHGIRTREGVIAITGISGAGKTTLCRTVLEELDRDTFTAVVLNPYISDEDLLRLILQDFGVISRDEVRSGRIAGAGSAELLRSLHEFLRSLVPLGARALVIVDEAQKLTLPVLGQIKRLACLGGTDTLLQIVLVGQLGLRDSLRSSELRDLDNRVTIRYRLRPLTSEETASYVEHRMAIAGERATTFAPRALSRVHRATAGNPRLVNLLCDRALGTAFAAQARRVEVDHVAAAARGLRLERSVRPVLSWFRRAAAL